MLLSAHRPTKTEQPWHHDVQATAVLGYKVASFECSDDAAALERTLNDCAASGVKLLRVRTHQILPRPVEDAPWFTGYPLAKVATFHRVLESIDFGANVVPGADASCARVPRHGPVSDLLHLLPVAVDGSPCTADPALALASSSLLHRAMLLTAVDSERLEVVRCRVDDVTVGFFVMSFDCDRLDPRAVLDQLIVSHDGWRRGAGSLLLRVASERARAAGAQTIVANVPTHQLDAINAFRRHGFREAAHVTVYHVWLPTSDLVRFNVPHITGREVANLKQAVEGNALDSLGPFTRACQSWMEDTLQSPMVLLTHSATAALEQAALLCGLCAGDEVVMPSYTFVSTASSVVLRGATPVFVDVDPDTLNVDAARIQAAITPRTKAIIVVHYAGIPCDMDDIMALAKERSLYVIEDAAQAFLSKYDGRYAGTIGHFGCYSFHYTKNTVCGEGGALCVNDAAFLGAAPIVREKGTNRSDFISKKVAKYEWVGLGSSFEPCELSAAFLLAQLEDAAECAQRRRRVCRAYHALLAPAKQAGKLHYSSIAAGPDESSLVQGNGHIFWVMFGSADERDAAERFVCSRGVQCFSHYVPLHLSPAGTAYGRSVGDMQHTNAAGSRLLRLPVWAGMNWTHVHRVATVLLEFVGFAPPTKKDTIRLFLPDMCALETMDNDSTAHVTIVNHDAASLSPKRVPRGLEAVGEMEAVGEIKAVRKVQGERAE